MIRFGHSAFRSPKPRMPNTAPPSELVVEKGGYRWVIVFDIMKMQANMISDNIYSLSPVSLAITIAALLISILYYILKRRDLPPGPYGLPYFGYWPFIKNINFHLDLDKMKKKYGDIFSFTSTGRLYINLGTIKAVREAHITKSDCFGDRMSDFNLLGNSFKDGVAFANGEPWKVIRKFFLPVMKERGTISIKNSMSGLLYDSIKSTIDDLKSRKGESFNIVEIMTLKCTSMLRLTLFGDVGATDEQIRKFNELYLREMMILLPSNLFLSGAFAKYFILPLNRDYRAQQKSHEQLENILREMIDYHKSTYDEENIRDIIDEYFKERDIRRKKGDPTAKFFTDRALIGTLTQFVGDGVFAVAATINFTFKCLMEYPEEQEKIYKEILEVVGLERQPTIEDKSKLTYLNAFIQETFRISDFFNFFPSQECVKETTLGGYRIPKGAITLLNFYSAHRDPETYQEPEKFNPSRFIQTEGKRKEELPMTFGVGKRACLGEGFTMMQVFLFLATIVQNFRLESPKIKDKNAYEIYTADKLTICAHLRDPK
ncbi:cytochrome P450 2B1 [Trichonephila clavata]|uniref:Cytochrome P450 2B1 n=1 Tax=Trichonephila clavata TaxID=2740835 RepID=A0A8X6FPK7_TRICU|nr:cytochrome P450 2B1 [Trichonephila clavata]